LLFKDISLWAPFPDKELSHFSRAHCNPFTSRVDAYRIDFVLSNLEWVDWSQCVDVIHRKHSIRLTQYKNFISVSASDNFTSTL
jgi:hypothetical protein